jgi:F-type H+-transporting ATPase subunit b
MKSLLRSLFLVALLSSLAAVSSPALTQDQSSATASSPQQKPSRPEPTSIGGELAKEEREATGEDEEENANLKHSSVVQKLGKLIGLNVHQAHLGAMILNFAIIVFVVVWFGRKALPPMFRSRNESIQRALDEARAASQDAHRRLAEIENRLRQLDVEIGQMQASAEKEAEAEEARIKKATEEDIRKVVASAEQEIAAAAKQARRELTSHTADLAIALARKQINVDANTDQVLVRNFAANLSQGGRKDGN